MTRIDSQLAQASEDIDLVLVALPDVLRRLRDGMAGQPGAQRYDTPVVGGHTTVLDERGMSMPAVSDPTGEAAVRAVMGGDPSSITQRRIAQLVATIAHAADELVTHVRIAQRRGPTDRERRDTDAVNIEPGCRSCARTEVTPGVRRWERVYRRDRCRWCASWAGIHGDQDPPLEVLERHHAGQRIRIKAG